MPEQNSEQTAVLDSTDAPIAKRNPPTRPSASPAQICPLPKPFCRGGLFAAVPQTAGRVVEIDALNLRYELGGCHPMKPDTIIPAPDIRHGRVLLAIISFIDRFSEHRDIRFSMYDFCMRHANYRGGVYSRQLLKLMYDLKHIWVRVIDSCTGKEVAMFRFIEEVYVSEKVHRRAKQRPVTDRQTELWLNGVTISAEFFEMLRSGTDLRYLRFDVVKQIKHTLAEAAYYFIPAAATFHPPGNKPHLISLATLCAQVAYPMPTSKKHQLRLLQGQRGRSRSVVEELNGKETVNGRLLASFYENKRGEYILQFWEEPRWADNREMGIIKRAWLESGRTEEECAKRLRHCARLQGYQIATLHDANVDLGESLPAFELALTLLEESKFDATISDVKHTVRERRLINGKTVINPTAFAISECVRAVRENRPSQPVAAPTKAAPQTERSTNQAPKTIPASRAAHNQTPSCWKRNKAAFLALPPDQKLSYESRALLLIRGNDFDEKRLADPETSAEHKLGLAINLYTEEKQNALPSPATAAQLNLFVPP